MNTTMNLLFYLKKPKVYSTGPIPIYLRVTVNSQRAEISTGRECEPDKWLSSAGRMSGTKLEAKTLNHYLDTIQAKAFEVHRQLLSSNEIITAETIKNKYLGKDEKPRSLLKIFQDHNNQMAALIGKEFAAGTLERYKTSLKHTRDFIAWKYHAGDIDIRKIDHAFITDYEFYLRSERNCVNNSAVKYIRNFGMIINICIANGWIERNPFVNYKAKVKEVDRVFLNVKEIENIASKQFVSERLNQVHDIFFSVVLPDWLMQMSKSSTDPKSLSALMARNGSIPIAKKPIPAPTSRYYQWHWESWTNTTPTPNASTKTSCCPYSATKKINSYLKEIADCCGINKELTFHIARHTFATTFTLTNGVSIESVSKMLGHRNLKTTLCKDFRSKSG